VVERKAVGASKPRPQKDVATHADLVTPRLGQIQGARLPIEPAAKNITPGIALAAALLPEDAVKPSAWRQPGR
jgi:hypothetical protein